MFYMKTEGIFWQYNLAKYLSLFIVFLLPLLINRSLAFPYTTGKALFFVISTFSVLCLFLWGLLRDKKIKISFGIVSVSIILFSLALVLSTIFAVVPRFALFGEISGASSLLIFSGISMAFVLSSFVKEDKNFIKILAWTSVISAVFVAIGAFGGEKILPSSTGGSTLGNTSYAGAYLLINLFLALGLVLTSKNLYQKIFLVLSILTISFSPIFFNFNIFKGLVSFSEISSSPTILFGAANGSALGVGIGLISVISIFLIRSKKHVLKWAGALLLIGLFTSLWWAGQELVNPDSKINQIYTQEKNANRFVFWDIAYAGINERPIFGWGVGGYAYLFQENYDSIFFSPGYAIELWTNNPHNMIIEHFVNAGVLGLFTYVLMIGSAGITLFLVTKSEDKNKRVFSTVLFGAIFGYVVQNFFVFDTVVPLMMFYIIIGFAIGVQKEKVLELNKIWSIIFKIFISLIIFISICLIYLGGIKPWREVSSLTSNLVNGKLLSKETDNISYMGYAGDSAFWAIKTSSMISADKNSTEEKKKKVKDVLYKNIEKIEDALVADGRENFRSRWVLGQLYLKIIAIDMIVNKDLGAKSIENYKKALEINSNNPMIYSDLAQAYAFEKDYKNSQKYIRAAIALAPEYKTNYKYADQMIKGGIATKEFEKYVKDMRDRWCYENSPCMTDKWK